MVPRVYIWYTVAVHAVVAPELCEVDLAYHRHLPGFEIVKRKTILDHIRMRVSMCRKALKCTGHTRRSDHKIS